MTTKLQTLCQNKPTRTSFDALLEETHRIWESYEEQNAEVFELLQRTLSAWYDACPVEYIEDDVSVPFYPEDPFELRWRDVWLSLCVGTTQLERYEAEDHDWPVPISDHPNHHRWMQCIRSLKIDADDFGDLDFHLFGQARHLQPTHLTIDLPNPYCDFDRDSFFAFPNFHCLVDLRFQSFRFSEDNLQKMISRLGAPLTRFQFDGRFGDKAARCLADNTKLEKLTVIDLSGTGLGLQGVEDLACGVFARNLTELYLSENKLGDNGVIAITESPLLSKVSRLVLCSNNISDKGAQILASCPHLHCLEELVLYDNHISEDGWRALKSSPHLKNANI